MSETKCKRIRISTIEESPKGGAYLTATDLLRLRLLMLVLISACGLSLFSRRKRS